MENYTNKLAEFAAELTYDKLPAEVIEQTKMFIADYYAAVLAGCGINREFNDALLSVLEESGGAEQSTVFFRERKFPAQDAAFINAAYAHGADMDDGNKKAAGHIGTHVMSAVFAVAEKLGVLWSDVFTAINVGYELFNRIAGAAQPSLYNKGFHSTGIAGAMACAGACAKLMGLDENGIYNSISLAAIQSSGLIIIDESGQECKPINPANAARTGVVSAMIASKGIVSSRDPLESRKGWFHAFCDEVNENVLLEGLGEKFTICESYLKLYPTCRHTHSCIDAVLELRKGLDIGSISRIEVFIYPSAIKSAGGIRFPKTASESKFSICYSIACALVKGRFGLSDLEPDYSCGDIEDIINKTELIVDESMEDRSKGIRGCRMKITTADGQSRETMIPTPKGEGSNALSRDDLIAKVKSCAEGIMDSERAVKLVEDCMNTEENSPFSILL